MLPIRFRAGHEYAGGFTSVASAEGLRGSAPPDPAVELARLLSAAGLVDSRKLQEAGFKASDLGRPQFGEEFLQGEEMVVPGVRLLLRYIGLLTSHQCPRFKVCRKP
jgi:hypothetical protein